MKNSTHNSQDENHQRTTEPMFMAESINWHQNNQYEQFFDNSNMVLDSMRAAPAQFTPNQ